MPLGDAVTELPPRRQDGGEASIVRRHRVQHVLGLFLERRHQLVGELADAGELLDALEIGLVAHVVVGDRVDVRRCRRNLDGCLVFRRQVVPQRQRELHLDRRARFPPARVVVEQIAGELVEAEDQVVGGSHELGAVDRTLLDRRQDLAARQGDLLAAEALEHTPRKTGDAHLQALQVADRIELLGEPAAHLAAGAAGREGDDAMLFGVELVEHVEAAALVQPGVLLALRQPERHSGAELLHGAEPDVVVRRRVARLHADVTHGRQHLKAAHDLASGSRIDLEPAAGEPAHLLGEEVRRAEQGHQRRRPARRHFPFDLGAVLGERHRCGRGVGGGGTFGRCCGVSVVGGAGVEHRCGRRESCYAETGLEERSPVEASVFDAFIESSLRTGLVVHSHR